MSTKQMCKQVIIFLSILPKIEYLCACDNIAARNQLLKILCSYIELIYKLYFKVSYNYSWDGVGTRCQVVSYFSKRCYNFVFQLIFRNMSSLGSGKSPLQTRGKNGLNRVKKSMLLDFLRLLPVFAGFNNFC